MRVLNIATSPWKEKSVSRAVVDVFLREYTTRKDDILVDTLDVCQERLPEFDADTIKCTRNPDVHQPSPHESTVSGEIKPCAASHAQLQEDRK
jgi:FMN-dependent NADH-azoreductase